MRTDRQLREERPLPPEEYPLPEEFGAHPCKPKLKKSDKKRWMFAAAAVVVLLPLLCHVISSTDSSGLENPWEIMYPDAVFYDNPNGELQIRIFNDTTTWRTDDTGFHEQPDMLFETTLRENDFTQITMPEPILQDDYFFRGYVICNTETRDYSALVGSILTEGDIRRVPVKDGVRRVDIHAVWEPLTLTDQKTVLLLLDGQAVSIQRPNDSDSWIYLRPYGEHWYDETGREVLCLHYLDFYHYVEDSGWDWDNPNIISLTSVKP